MPFKARPTPGLDPGDRSIRAFAHYGHGESRRIRSDFDRSERNNLWWRLPLRKFVGPRHFGQCFVGNRSDLWWAFPSGEQWRAGRSGNCGEFNGNDLWWILLELEQPGAGCLWSGHGGFGHDIRRLRESHQSEWLWRLFGGQIPVYRSLPWRSHGRRHRPVRREYKHLFDFCQWHQGCFHRRIDHGCNRDI